MILSSVRDEIKAAVKVSQYIGSTRRVDCPEPHCDGKGKRADCQAYDDSWYCFICKARGDIFTWVMLTQSCSFGAAIRVLADYAGIPLEPHPERCNLLEKVLSESVKYLRQNQDKLNYLSGRGLDRSTLEAHSVGYMDLDCEVLEASGLTQDQMLDLGLLYAKSGGNINYLEGRYIFPIRDTQGRLISLKGRANPVDLPDLDSRRKSMPLKADGKWGRHSHMDHLYLEDLISKYEEYVFICEGEPDTLTLRSWGINAVGMMTNTGIVKHAHKLAKFERIYFVLDNDDKTQRHIVTELYSLQMKLPKARILNVTLPQLLGDDTKIDVNDYKSKCGMTKKDFHSLATNSPEAAEIIIREWVKHFRKDRNYSAKIYGLVRTVEGRRDELLELLSTLTKVPVDMLAFAADTVS